VPWSVALRDGVVLKAVAVDVFLLVLFSLQHSVLAWAPVKSVCQRVFGVLSRTVYCFTTAAALQVPLPMSMHYSFHISMLHRCHVTSLTSEINAYFI